MEPNEQQDKKFSGQEILRDLIPLNALGEDRYREVAASLTIRDIPAGSYLFGEGDRDNRSIYLLDGVVNFIDSSGKVTGVVSAGTDPARYPLANQQPRITTARAATKSVIASIDSSLLDVMLTLDQTAETSGVEIATGGEQDWMTRMLQSEAFSRMAPADIQRLIQALQQIKVSAGDTIIRQGDEGDYYYIIREGTCSVSRLASSEGWDVPLTELGPGDCFGEDALVSDATRNATVTMLTDGSLMRLSKQQFIEILKKPLVHYVEYNTAIAAVKNGDILLDVRTADEFSNNALRHSINMPLATIRESMKKLDATRRYVVYCNTGRRSAAAAFLLGQRGFDVAVLEGGLDHARLADPALEAGLALSIAPMDEIRVTTPPAAQPARTARPASTSGGGETNTMRRQLADAQAGEAAARARLHQLQDKLTTLRSELQKYTDRVMQVEIAHQS
ncbi:MAG: cyclic nucleotide-binding domain-containing protein, partial [Thiohalobacterales bacterium]|nr:cyclic nucleotide-binding domain-containing protein [Thiohalobacterales bacterium]